MVSVTAIHVSGLGVVVALLCCGIDRERPPHVQKV